MATSKPIQDLGQEHVVVLERLQELSQAIGGQSPKALQVVKEVAQFLDGDVERHLRKEEEALFPPVERIIGAEGGPTHVMRLEHVDLRAKRDELLRLLTEESGEVSEGIKATSQFIITLLEQHIDKEDNILFPMAQEFLEADQWAKIEAKMGEIEKEAANQVVLDVRPMPPWERHPKIFDLFDKLKSGQTLKLINDHDPRPLHYQFLAERKDQFIWVSEEKGPQEWVALITKV